MKSIDSRLAALEAVVGASRPCKFTVTLTDGTRAIEDAESVWEYFRNDELREKVSSVEADQESYDEIACLIEVLCGVNI